MSKTLVIKNSMVPGKVPTNSDLQWGELALNIPDKTIYSMDVEGVVRKWNVTPEELQGALGGVNSVTDLGISVGNDWMTISSSTGNNINVPIATPTTIGLMSTADKVKLDQMEVTLGDIETALTNINGV